MKNFLKCKNVFIISFTIIILLSVFTPWLVIKEANIDSFSKLIGLKMLTGHNDNSFYIIGIICLLLALFITIILFEKDTKNINIAGAVIFGTLTIVLLLTKTIYFKTTLNVNEYIAFEEFIDSSKFGYGLIISIVLSFLNTHLCLLGFITMHFQEKK